MKIKIHFETTKKTGRISNISLIDAGTYACHAENKKGDKEEKSVVTIGSKYMTYVLLLFLQLFLFISLFLLLLLLLLYIALLVVVVLIVMLVVMLVVVFIVAYSIG